MISILDCTLRDGGYINDFTFGRKCISEIISSLAQAKIEIIECGFLKSGANDPDKSLFGSVSTISKHLPDNKDGTMYVAMIAYGDIPIEEIEPYDGTSISGIRLTFHEQDIDRAFDFANRPRHQLSAVHAYRRCSPSRRIPRLHIRNPAPQGYPLSGRQTVQVQAEQLQISLLFS